MRPVDKWTAGTHGVQEQYGKYQDAKPALIANLGPYCSYCETRLPYTDTLHVEHVMPKKHYPALEKCWDNFLLACPVCNGRGNKGDTVPPAGCHLPHTANTYLSLVYRRGGVVVPNPALAEPARTNAGALLALTGLDKGPADQRSKARQEVWVLAERYRAGYDSGQTNADTVLDLAKACGHWSVWFTVFNGCDEVRQRLINEFPGTPPALFDAACHYAPLPRNQQQADPT